MLYRFSSLTKTKKLPLSSSNVSLRIGCPDCLLDKNQTVPNILEADRVVAGFRRQIYELLSTLLTRVSNWCAGPAKHDLIEKYLGGWFPILGKLKARIAHAARQCR